MTAADSWKDKSETSFGLKLDKDSLNSYTMLQKTSNIRCKQERFSQDLEAADSYKEKWW